jgi:seryl-tRNA synthetase
VENRCQNNAVQFCRFCDFGASNNFLILKLSQKTKVFLQNRAKFLKIRLNDAASKKYDLEAWFPGDNEGRGQYRELVSCSNCNDYQSRAMNTKHGFAKSGEKQEFCHMLNSTLCATERALCCLVENYQDETGVRVPEALRPYCMGIEHFPFVKAEPTPEKDDKKKDKKSKGA